MALKGKRLAFVEVKRRKSLDEAGWSLPTRARRRIVRAAQYWLAGHPDYAGHDLAFDVVLAAPWAWPRYIRECISSLGIPIRPEQSPLTVETLVTLRL